MPLRLFTCASGSLLPCRFSSGDVQSYQLWIYGEQEAFFLGRVVLIGMLIAWALECC